MSVSQSLANRFSIVAMKHHPDFRSAAFLREHLLQTLAFYDGHGGRALDPSGGLYQFFKDDGSVYDAHTRHLVSSTRYVVTFANAAAAFPNHPRAAAWLATARHALAFVQNVHRDPASGGYTWLLCWHDGQREVLDATQHCYGLAFVLLAHAQALKAGVEEARAGLHDTIETDGAPLLDPHRRPLCRRGQPRLATAPLPRPKRQHARLRGHAGGL